MACKRLGHNIWGMTLAVIRIGLKETGRIAVTVPYDPKLVTNVKGIEGRRWHPEEKIWSLPATDGMVERLMTVCVGEEVNGDSTLLPVSNSGQETVRLVEAQVTLRGYSPKTCKAYRGHVERFTRFCARDPNEIGECDVQRYLLHVLEQKATSHAYVHHALSALKFLYKEVLPKSCVVVNVPRPKRERKLPEVLSREEVVRLLDAVDNPQHRAIMFLTYSAGFRLGEVVRLNVEDVDSDRRLVHIRQGKGRTDRSTVLSQVAWEALSM